MAPESPGAATGCSSHDADASLRRLVALGALVVALVAVLAAPASAHASLLSTDPSNGGVYDTPPKAITLRFNEGGRGLARRHPRLHQRPRARRQREPRTPERAAERGHVVVAEARPTAPTSSRGGSSRPTRTRSRAPTRSRSGSKATLSDKNAQERGRVAAGDDGRQPHRRRRVRHRPRRPVRGRSRCSSAASCSSPAVWPRGTRRPPRAGGWCGAVDRGVGHHRARHRARGRVRAPGSRSATCSTPTVFRDVLDTRYGHVALVRLALLVLAIPLLRVLLHRRPAAEHPLARGGGSSPRSWSAPASRSRPASPATRPPASRPGSRSRPTSCTWRRMACWLGGLVLLCVAVLPRRNVDELRKVLPRYSALALGAIVALVVSGGYQAWRQVGSIDELKSTDYGRLLIAKLVAFAALIVAAAFSREVVNRRFRDLPARRRRARHRRRPGARRRRRSRDRIGGTVRGDAGAGRRAASGRRSTTTATTTTGTTTPRTRRR